MMRYIFNEKIKTMSDSVLCDICTSNSFAAADQQHKLRSGMQNGNEFGMCTTVSYNFQSMFQSTSYICFNFI